MEIASELLKTPGAIYCDEKKAQPHLREFLEKLDTQPELPENLQHFLAAVFGLSSHLKSCALRDPEFVLQLMRQGFGPCAGQLLAETVKLGIEADTESQVMKALRVNKRRLALLCGLADLGGWWTGEQVTNTLSNFAKAALHAALDFILLQHHNSGKLQLSDVANPQESCGIIVIGMGKLGAGELNYSSDIDLILFFEHAASIKLNTDDPITMLSRMARQLIKIMQERTADGYVFRMDLRLRPDPSSTPLVIPVEAALNYYEGQGQNWERAAMIKAKAVAGDLVAGEQFLSELAPFVWRKYLDFAAINDIHSIKRQIHAHKGHGEIQVKGHNVKLGRGGIREIEFFVQTQQLIAGGRRLELRTNKTITALKELADLGWIEAHTADEMGEAYWFLRNIEHRLQMVADEQTHTLPEKEGELLRIANMCGYENTRQFSRKIRDTLALVSDYYADLFEGSDNLSSEEGNLVFTGNEPDPGTIETLSRMGYRQPETIIKTVKSWHVAKIPALRTTKAREILTELVPGLLSTFGKTENPDDTMILFDRFISGLPAGIQLFSILQSNLALSGLVLKLLTSAPRLARQISQQPHVFDAMLDPDFANDEISHDNLLEHLSSSLERAPDYESALDIGRRFFNEASFLYGCQFFSGILSLQHLKTAFSTLGDVMVTAMYKCVCIEFEKRHGIVGGAQACVLGMGRLGSRELTATSDLDLIFLYDFDEADDMSDGEKPLPAALYFTRLMQRFISAMSSPTSEGIIYDLDFRLRPSGNAGPLATHVDGFFKYQHEEAWVWEAQSLTRARPIAGDEALMTRVASEIPKILEGFSKRDDLKVEVRNMRMRIEKEKGSKNVWDVKTRAGGLLDIEFIAQYFVILGEAPNGLSTGEAISSVSQNFMDNGSRQVLLNALELYERILHFQRICLGENADMATAPAGYMMSLCEVVDLPDINACKAHLSDVEANVRTIFNTVMA